MLNFKKIFFLGLIFGLFGIVSIFIFNLFLLNELVKAASGGVITINGRITGVSDPINNNDAATKNYVSTALTNYITMTCFEDGALPSDCDCPSGWTFVTSTGSTGAVTSYEYIPEDHITVARYSYSHAILCSK